MDVLKRVFYEQHDVFPLIIRYYLWIWYNRLDDLHFELRARTDRIRWYVEDNYGHKEGAQHVYMHCYRVPMGKTHHAWMIQSVYPHQDRWCDLHWPLVGRLDSRAQQHGHGAFCCYP